MSTRANIKVIDGTEELWFYRHSDGYPEGAMPLLEEFMKHVKDGTIRDNISQASGWLVWLGAKEYDQKGPGMPGMYAGYEWKVGSIEPTTGQHGDIEYLYTIDLQAQTITIEEV
jgi:hypothetical protein